MATVVGSGSAAATSVAIPAHQVGDLIIVAARGTAAAPSIPAAGGTVPAWVSLQSGLANAIGLTVAAFTATATTTTTGTWTNATHICVIVLRPGSGKLLQTSAARSSVGNGNNTQTIVYPALTLAATDGSSWGVRVGTRTVAVTAVGTAPTGWTNQLVQPAGASALMAVHYRSGLTANPAADSVSTAGTNAAYRAVTVEVQEINAVQTVSVNGVVSAQSFGTQALVQPQTKQVFGVPPPSYDLHVSGEYLAGQALVGWTGGDQFGDPVVQILTAQPVAPGGVASAQAFGVPTIRAVVRPAAGGVSSSQAFGTPTIRTVVAPSLGGVATAQAFGTPTIKTAISRAVTGLGSAQAFGTPVALATQIKPVGGVASAQSFGTPSLQTGPVTKPVGGVSSAQAFGTLTLAGTGGISVAGIPSAQAFGSVRILVKAVTGGVPTAQSFGAISTATALTRSVTGLGSAQAFGSISIQRGIVVGSVSSAQAFGTIKTAVRFTPLGLGSAQSFGAVRISIRYGLGGVPSAQAFGTARIVTVVQVPGLQHDWRPHIVGSYKAGQAVVGGTGEPLFGTPGFKLNYLVPGVPSAQAFGTISFRTGPVSFQVLGLGSAQAFGVPDAFSVFQRPAPCLDLDLDPDLERALTLALASCLTGDGVLCGTFLCGQRLCGEGSFLVGSLEPDLVLTPVTGLDLTLEPAEVP